MRRGSRGQKNKKYEEVQSDVDEDMSDSVKADDETGSGSGTESSSSPVKKRNSRNSKATTEEDKDDVEKEENGKSSRRRKKDDSMDIESDLENGKPVNKKKKGKSDEDNDKSQEENGKEETNGKSSSKSKKKDSSTKNNKEVEEDDDDGEPEYEVDKIVDMRTIKGRRQFRIRWKGYTEESDTWEHEKELNCDKLIEEFLTEQDENEEEKEESAKKIKKTNKKGKGKKKDLPADDEGEDSDDAKEYEVEKIIDVHFKKDKKREFLIRWKNFSAKDDTWEPEEYLNCPELIEKFMEKLEKIKSHDSRELRANPSHTNRYTLTMHGDKRQSRRNAKKERKTYFECD